MSSFSRECVNMFNIMLYFTGAKVASGSRHQKESHGHGISRYSHSPPLESRSGIIGLFARLALPGLRSPTRGAEPEVAPVRDSLRTAVPFLSATFTASARTSSPGLQGPSQQSMNATSSSAARALVASSFSGAASAWACIRRTGGQHGRTDSQNVKCSLQNDWL